MKEELLRFMADMIDCVETAIKSGDWKVDGSCDPEALIEGGKFMLDKYKFKQDDEFVETA